MSDIGNKYLTGAIALCAIAYFFTHLHVAVATSAGTYVITNTVTGTTKYCTGRLCYELGMGKD